MKSKHSLWLAGLMILGWTSLAIAETFVVTNTNDSGAGSLRQAIAAADSQVGADAIVFNIPTSDPNYDSATGVWSIRPDSAFPLVSHDSTSIDGTTQTVNRGDLNPSGPEIEIDGTSVDAHCFSIEGLGNKIQGLVINRFSGDGVVIYGDGNKISGNYIGTNATGTEALPTDVGVVIRFGAKFNIIGGSTPEERNLISGNAMCGIGIDGSGTDSNEVKGNYIGTDASGDSALGNVLAGIYIEGGPTGSVIGGSAPGERNIISGTSHRVNIYTGNGITLEGANGNMVVGNYIGTNKNGTAAVPNANYGVAIIRSQLNVIGGTGPGEGNVISGNDVGGVFIRFSDTVGNDILGNYIGTDAAGLAPLGNAHEGVYLDYGARDNVIGPSNIIANNGYYGVICRHDSTVGNTITRNSITNHWELGIWNDEGASNGLAPPVISDVSPIHVSGTACPDCVVEIFSDVLDEGAVYDGFSTADASGDFLWPGTAAGPVVTATATDTEGNTSEFSDPFLPATEDSRESQAPDRLVVGRNFPNPFGPSTEIRYALPRGGRVSVRIVDSLGREVTTLLREAQGSGYHSVAWDGRDSSGKRVSSGVYCCRVEVGDWTGSRRLVLVE